jgi:DNA-binding response OmpR family regulator
MPELASGPSGSPQERGTALESGSLARFTVRVLILEDDPFIALDLQDIVEGEGHEVIGVHRSLADARNGLSEPFEFALLDVDVLDGKSFELASALRERKIPFAFVSGSSRNELPPKFRDAHFIAKPFREAAIARLLPLR